MPSETTVRQSEYYLRVSPYDLFADRCYLLRLDIKEHNWKTLKEFLNKIKERLSADNVGIVELDKGIWQASVSCQSPQKMKRFANKKRMQQIFYYLDSCPKRWDVYVPRSTKRSMQQQVVVIKLHSSPTKFKIQRPAFICIVNSIFLKPLSEGPHFLELELLTDILQHLDEEDSIEPNIDDIVFWSTWCKRTPKEVAKLRTHKKGTTAKASPSPKLLFEEIPTRLTKLCRSLAKGIKPNENLYRKGLCRFVLMKILEKSCPPPTYWKSNAASHEDIATYLSGYAEVICYLLKEQSASIKKEAMQGLIFSLSEFTHRFLDLPKRIDSALHLLQASRGEPVLHSLRHYYRDHFFHSLEVCFLGHFLLELDTGDNKPIWEKIANQMKLTGNKQDVYKQVLQLWYLTALLHDVGYGIDALNGVLDLLGFFRNAIPLKQLRDDLQKALDKLSSRLTKEKFMGYRISDNPGEDHGVIAARHLDGLLKAIAKEDPKVKEDIKKGKYQPAIRAIALHNSRKHIVRFDDDPLAFLLILCDTIQEWNRIQFNFATAPVEILSKLQGYGVREEDLTGPLQQVKINAVPITTKDGKLDRFRTTDKGKIRFTLEYGEGIQKNAGVFNLWIDASCNLQRLNFGELKDKIDIEYVTPWYRGEDGTLEQQFYRLRDAKRETSMGFLSDWFPEKENSEKTGVTNGAVEYIAALGTDGHSKKERLILHLPELTKIKRITKSFAEFQNYLKQWRRYNDDRDFSGVYADIIPS